jgi:hypothetical protein
VPNLLPGPAKVVPAAAAEILLMPTERRLCKVAGCGLAAKSLYVNFCFAHARSLHIVRVMGSLSWLDRFAAALDPLERLALASIRKKAERGELGRPSSRQEARATFPLLSKENPR